MFGSTIISSFHYSFIETSQVFKVRKVRCFNKTEIVRGHAIYIIHQYPFIFTDALPYSRSLTSFRLKIIPARIILIIPIHTIRNCLLDSCRPIVGDIKQVIFIPHFRNVSINSRNILIRIFKQNLRQAFNGIKLIIYIYIIQFVRFISKTHRVINHQFSLLFIICYFRSPCTTYFTQSCR